MRYFEQILHNPIFLPTITAWIGAQVLKVVLTLAFQRKLNWALLLSSGGMPSSHSASVTCAAITAGLVAGFDSLAFGIATVFALVVMYDAAGVRRAAGIQARRLNNLIETFFAEHYINQKKLKELLGHKPNEVLAGCLLGAIIAIAFHF